ncbi:uncharacterized protein BDFB_008010, partial [Asbolus verrucosus]
MDKASTSDNSQLLRRLIEEKVNSTLDEPLSKLINESESHDVQEIIKKLDLKSMEDDILKKNRKSYPTPWSNINLNRCDYTVIIEGLNSNSTITKLKILDKLLSIQIIDTKQKLWGDLSQSLRKCFVSANNEIFIRTLKIHHRIIAFPNSSCDGYLSLLKSTFLLLNSRYFTDLNKNRILQTLQLIIDAQNIVIKFLLHANRNLIDEVVAAFVNVISFKSVFDWFGLLDPKTNWLRNFCYGTYIRNVFFSHLKEKTPDFVKHIIATFIKKSLNSDDCEKSVLAELVVNLFAYNPSLLNQKILDVLVEPLGNISRNNIRNLVENNKHLLTIINNVAKSRNFKVLFGVCSKLRKGRSRQLTRNSTNLPQKIVDLSVILLRSHLNQNEKNTQDENVLLSMLLCCRNIYECHPIALIHVNPSKLIQNLHDFYRLSWKNNNTDMKDVILGLFKFFYSNYGATIKILGCNNEILDDLFGFVPSDDLKMIINRIATDKYGFELLKSNYGQIVKPYLEQIWFCYENDEENDFVKFILFLFVVKLSTRATVAFLFDDEESTVVESNDKTVVLVELIEKSLNNFNCEPVEEYLGLLAMKVMMVNLDLLLYLQANHQMQEKLKSLEDSEDENVIIDAQTSLRRNILISLEMIGFPSNKCNKNILQTTDFAPIPQIFEIFEFSPNGHELKTFLENNSSNTDFSWLLQARRAFRNSLEFFDNKYQKVMFIARPNFSGHPLTQFTINCTLKTSVYHWFGQPLPKNLILHYKKTSINILARKRRVNYADRFIAHIWAQIGPKHALMKIWIGLPRHIFARQTSGHHRVVVMFDPSAAKFGVVEASAITGSVQFHHGDTQAVVLVLIVGIHSV